MVDDENRKWNRSQRPSTHWNEHHQIDPPPLDEEQSDGQQAGKCFGEGGNPDGSLASHSAQNLSACYQWPVSTSANSLIERSNSGKHEHLPIPVFNHLTGKKKHEETRKKNNTSDPQIEHGFGQTQREKNTGGDAGNTATGEDNRRSEIFPSKTYLYIPNFIVKERSGEPAQKLREKHSWNDVMSVIPNQQKGWGQNGAVSHAKTAIDQFTCKAKSKKNESRLQINPSVTRDSKNEKAEDQTNPSYAFSLV